MLPDGRYYDFWEKETKFKKEIHVDCSYTGNDSDGSAERPFVRINDAAKIADACTRVLIHAGTYRECVSPEFGGNSPEEMVVYEAFGDGEVIIKASEVVTEFEESFSWRRSMSFEAGPDENLHIYRHELDANMFMGYNPFCAINMLHDRLFIEYEKTDMTTYLNRRGMVFCDGKPLKQVALHQQMSVEDGTYWVEHNGQTVHFRLKNDESPADHVIELTVREQCFAPKKEFLNYIKVKGITAAHAATGAPVPQRGAISAHRGHHWVVENCTIDWSNCLGIDLGNECWNHSFDTERLIGNSVVRGCTIRDCGVCGIAGLHTVRMLIEDNLIEGTGWQKMELSWEAGAIKIHNSVDGLYRRNIFRNTFRADHIWLDCGNENNRITRNLFLDGIEQREAVFIECTRDGVNLLDHNIFWNVEGRFDKAKVKEEPGSKGWYKMVEEDVINGYAIYGEGTDHLRVAGNLIGKVRGSGYYSKPVAFRHFGMERGGTSRDARFAGNLFYDCGEAAITFPTEHNMAEGNSYVKCRGGYLRVMHPEPELVLHLPAWQEFLGFDMTGHEGWFDIEVDTKELTLTFKPSSSPVPLFFGDRSKRPIAGSVEELLITDSEKLSEMLQVPYDAAFGTDLINEQPADNICAGAIFAPKEGLVYNIDPRRDNK